MPVLLGLAQEKVDKLKRYLDKTLSADVGCKIEWMLILKTAKVWGTRRILIIFL